MLAHFDKVIDFLLVDCKLGYVFWGSAVGALAFAGEPVPWYVIAMMAVGGVAGMFYCALAERRRK